MLLLASRVGSGSVGAGSAGCLAAFGGESKTFHRLLFPVSSSSLPRFVVFSSLWALLESRASAGGRCCAGKPLCSSRLNYFQKAAGSEGKEGRENVQEAARQGWVCKGGRCLGDVGSRGRAVPCKKSSHLWEGWKAATLEGPRSTRWVTGQQAHSVGSL